MTPGQVNLRQVGQHFSGHANEYDRYAIVQKQVARQVVDVLPASLEEEPLSVLDVGTGTGEVLLHYQQRFGCGDRLLGMDLSRAMCDVAAQRVPKADFLIADAQDLPFETARFDRVLSSSVYQWMNDLPGAFEEAGRVLRSEGWFGFALFGERTLFELKASFREALAQTASEQRDYTQDFPTLEEVRSALISQDWEEISLQSTEAVEWHPDPKTMMRRLKKIGAHNASADRPTGLPSRRLVQTMLESYERLFSGPQGVPASYEVILGRARKK